MTKARARPLRGRGSAGGATAPSQRDLFRRAAQQLGVSASDYERADILAQIAESSELPEGCDLHVQFTTALAGAQQTWPRGLIIVSDPPEWTEVERVLNATYKPLLRNPLRRR